MLVLDNILSIGSVVISLNSLSKHSHVFAIGFLPVYIGLMVFGSSLLAFYFGNQLQGFLMRLFKHKPHYSNKCKNDAIHLVRKSPSQVNSNVG